jgi:hypothetical protein
MIPSHLVNVDFNLDVNLDLDQASSWFHVFHALSQSYCSFPTAVQVFSLQADAPSLLVVHGIFG